MSTIEEQQRIVRQTCHAYVSLPLLPISRVQAQSSKERPNKGGVRIDRSNFPAPPENSLKSALFEVIEELKNPEHSFMSPQQLSQVEVGVEFISAGNAATDDKTNPNAYSHTRSHKSEDKIGGDSVILYMHGGGLYFSSPAEYRASSIRLAHLTGAVVASTSYRLCPQNTFPAPIFDVLVAYASLLYPPSASRYHLLRPTPASKIVLAGNSAGANLAFGVLKFLLEFNKRTDPTILFHGQRIHLPVPAGVAVASAWCDPTDCLPSWLNPNGMDILTSLQPALLPEFPADAIWPSSPPREHPYARAMNLDHELICPAAVGDWTGAPPIWFAVGEQERGRDGNAVVAARAASCGAHITWTEWEGMCHEWMIVTRGLPQASKAFMMWADACKRMVEGSEGQKAVKRNNTALRYRMPDCKPIEIKGGVESIMPLPFESVRQLMRIRNKQRPIWVGTASTKTMKKEPRL